MKLEDLARGIRVRGIIPNQTVAIVDVVSYGPDAVEITYKQTDGKTDSQLLYREDTAQLEIAAPANSWNLEADSDVLRLVSEAYRIHLAHLFDPRLAVHTSLIQPLPHQITAVYGEMLPRQPLRFLLADDPGAGKTIMAGLLIKELMVRGDVQRCLICAPGSLTEQWQDELWQKFQLRFEILSRERIETSHSGNPFLDEDRLIIRLDQVARDEDLQDRLRVTDWDLIVCDEAHKMSASFFGSDLKETKRYKLGRLLSSVGRHFLLMTATPHNGKEEDFQLFMALLDQDRFEGRFRDGVHKVDTSDMMRRMVKESLLKFDGRPLFPERRAYTVDYHLSPEEHNLYEAVTEYVREEFNRAEQLQHGGRRGTVGFALTVLQRRLASSPEAIYQSLHRRRKRLEKRVKETRLKVAESVLQDDLPEIEEDEWDDFDEFADTELEELEIELVDSATAAQTIAELEFEIETLRRLEAQAAQVRRNGNDKKWEQLASLLEEDMMFSQEGHRRKLVIFTEHRDTLEYLRARLATLLGNPDEIVTIHGGIRRQHRLEVQDQFRNDPDVTILLATDAAGEGINLQRAHLMVNYDLPWNPNRLEQRFGRIHRIGQEEVCHLWNLVAGQTREGHVYHRLLRKLEVERQALGGQVFDVLGRLFREEPLRNLLVEAIRYGDRPDVRARLDEVVDNATDRHHVQDLFEEHSLVQNVMDTRQLERVRAEMERAAALRLQPYYIKAFFMDAFSALNGRLFDREPGRYQINHVPAPIRNRGRDLGGRMQIGKKYERICFDKADINLRGKPSAEFICPGHILLDTTIDLVLREYRDIMTDGAILIDPTDPGDEPRALFYLEHTLRDATEARRVISQKVEFLEFTESGEPHRAGVAPYLDYRAPTDDERTIIEEILALADLFVDIERQVKGYAVAEIAPQHLQAVREHREALIDKTLKAVKARLQKEINYWDRRANELRAQERSGKRNVRLNAQRAQQRADELAERLNRREQELEEQRQISASAPIIVGRALIIPIGMLLEDVPVDLKYRQVTEQIAMRAVIETEIQLGNTPVDVSHENVGYDIESRGRDGRLRFLEVKGRRAGADTVTVSHNEIQTALNCGEQYALVIVEVEHDHITGGPHYIWNPPFSQPDSTIVSVNLDLHELLELSEPPT